MLQSKLVQIWLTAANSPQSSSFESALNVSAQSNMKAYKTSVYLLLTGSPSFHYGSVQSQLRLCSLTHWAIHHRWQRLLWKLAAVLPLGKKHLNGAKMAPGKPCDVKDFFAFIFGQPCLSCCNRITNLFYLAKHWAIRTHFIIMTEQCVTNLANGVWKWIGRERATHTEERKRCDGLGPLPEGWVGGRALGQHYALFHISWALNSAHGQSSSHWILALGR